LDFQLILIFLPNHIVNNLAQNPEKMLNTKDNPIDVHEFTHETRKFKRLYGMGPLIGDNFVRFGTGGALAITSAIANYKKHEEIQKQQQIVSKTALDLKKSKSNSAISSLLNITNKTNHASNENLNHINNNIKTIIK